MIELEIAIDLIVPDNTAYTVLVTLRELGYESLERVERSEIIRLQADARSTEWRRILDRIKLAEVIYNPNKHSLSYVPPEQQPPRRVASPNGATGWEALVTDRDDDTFGIVHLLQGPFGMTELRSLTRGVAWRLYDAHGPSPKERVEWACRELLANPYSQTFDVGSAPDRIID